jgi:hypothetical protein
MFQEVKLGRCVKLWADCWAMWDSRRVTTQQASTARYRDSFTFLLYLRRHEGVFQSGGAAPPLLTSAADGSERAPESVSMPWAEKPLALAGNWPILAVPPGDTVRFRSFWTRQTDATCSRSPVAHGGFLHSLPWLAIVESSDWQRNAGLASKPGPSRVTSPSKDSQRPSSGYLISVLNSTVCFHQYTSKNFSQVPGQRWRKPGTRRPMAW